MDYEEPAKPIEFQITSEYQKVLNDILPIGYSLQQSNKPNKKEGQSKSSKKVQLEGGSYQQKDVNSMSKISDKVALKKQLSIQNINNQFSQNINENTTDSQILLTNNLSSQTLNQKQASQVSPTSIHSRDSKRHLRTKRSKNDSRTLDLDNMYPSGQQKMKALTEELKKCNKILQQLKKHNCSGPFLYPVDPVELNCHDYFDVVKEPIDLSTIENQLKAGLYVSSQQFAGDVRKIWSNSYLYNKEGSQIYQMTSEIHNYFEKLYKELEAPPAYVENSVVMLQKQVEQLSKELKELNSSKQRNGKGSKKTKATAQSKMNTVMNMSEKRNLCQAIRQLPPEHLKGVWEIVSSGHLNHSNREVLEFDIDTLPIKKTRELENYVKNRNALLQKQRQKKKGTKAQQQQQQQIQQQQMQQQQLTFSQQQSLEQHAGGYNQYQGNNQQFNQMQQQMQQQQQHINNNSYNNNHITHDYNNNMTIQQPLQQQNVQENISNPMDDSDEQSEQFMSDSEDSDN